MRYRCLVLLGVLVAVIAVASVSVSAQAGGGTTSGAAPVSGWNVRTAWGDPDLQGIWRFTSTEFERPEELAGREFLTEAEIQAKLKRGQAGQALRLSGKATNRAFRSQENYNSIFSTSDEEVRVNRRTSTIVDPPDGLLPPWTLEQVKRWEEREAASRGRGEGQTVRDINSGARCITDLSAAKAGAWGLGFGPKKTTIVDGDALGRGDRYDAGEKRILQSKGWVAMLGEQSGEYFYIPLDGRPKPGPKIRQWNGLSRGRWDGNTLVVEITNVYYDYPLIPNGGFQAYPGTGETLRVIQRFTRTGRDSLEYRFTVEDPAVYTRPYTVVHEMYRDDEYKVSPDLCHENNRNMGNVLANARADEFQAVENHALSVRIRQPRLEEIKRRAQEAAAKQGTSSR
jgi:hypothetical protein